MGASGNAGLRKSFGCLTALCAVKQTFDFRDSSPGR
jgi:hypothetical protein